MPLPSYLRRRGHTWFLRWKWPSRLAASGSRESLFAALRPAISASLAVGRSCLSCNIETMTSPIDLPKRAELESAVRRWIDDSVWRREIKRAETGGLDFFERHEIENDGPRGRQRARRPVSVCVEHVRASGEGSDRSRTDRRYPDELHRSIIAGGGAPNRDERPIPIRWPADWSNAPFCAVMRPCSTSCGIRLSTFRSVFG